MSHQAFIFATLMEEIYHGGTTVTIHIDNSRGGQISCASMVLSVNG